MTTYVIFLIIITISCGAYTFFTLTQRKKHNLIMQHVHAYERTDEQLECWLRARPHLYVGDCAYASSLVQQLLTIVDELEQLGRKGLVEQRPYLLGLLSEHAPPDDPPPEADHFH
jgi:hypothetical protein